MAQNPWNGAWSNAPANMPNSSGAWNQPPPPRIARPAAGGYGDPGYNAYSGGTAGLLSNGQAYTPAAVGRYPTMFPPIVPRGPNNFGPGNGPGGYGGGVEGNGGGYYGGGDPF